MGDARVPPMKEGASDEDARTYLYNQERMLSNQEQMITVTQSLLENQRSLATLASKFEEHLDLLSEQMRASIHTMGEFNKAIIKVPIVLFLIGMASWGFYVGKVSEKTWLLILAVACFPYLGDSITAIAKLIRGGSNGAGKK